MENSTQSNTIKLSTTKTTEYKLITVTENGLDTSININVPLLTMFLIFIPVLFLFARWIFNFFTKGFIVDEVSLKDPFTKTTVKIKANREEKKIAHKIWTELITRKAALPFEKDKDVIVEVYDSWHKLFQCVREQISILPVEKLKGREKKDIENLIDISTKVLNDGLRPHLTEWQARFRLWYEQEKEESQATKSPQEIQKEFPEYDLLVSDIVIVNNKLVKFAGELKKLVRS